MDIKNKKLAIQESIKSIESSKLPDGTKSDILETLNNLQTEIEAIEPLYENIDALKNLLIEPTNKEIEKSYKKFASSSKKSEIKNNLFFVIGLILAVIGLVPAISSMIKKSTEHTITYSYNDLNELLDEFGWAKEINYTYQNNILNSCVAFKLTSITLNQMLTLEIEVKEQYLTEINELSADEKTAIHEMIKNIFASFFGEYVPITLVNCSKRYAGYVLTFHVPERNLSSIEIFCKLNDVCTIVTQTHIQSWHEATYDKLNFGVNRKSFILDVSNLIYMLLGKKYILSIEDTVLSRGILNYHNNYDLAIILREKQ